MSQLTASSTEFESMSSDNAIHMIERGDTVKVIDEETGATGEGETYPAALEDLAERHRAINAIADTAPAREDGPDVAATVDAVGEPGAARHATAEVVDRPDDLLDRFDDVDMDEAVVDAVIAWTRSQLQAERTERERRFRLIAEHIDEVIYLGSIDLSEVNYINPAYEDIWGRSVEELYEDAEQFLDYIHPADREDYVSVLQGWLADIEQGDCKDRYQQTYRIQRPDGEIRWVRATGYPVLSDDGRDELVGVVTDVTERKQREQELRETEEQFQLVMENVDELIFLSRGIVGSPAADDGDAPDVEPLYLNPAFEDIYGRPVEAVYERPAVLHEAVHQDDRAAYVATLDRMGAAARRDDPQDVYEMTFRIRRPDGEVRWVERSVYPIPPTNGERYLWVAISRDITDQKRREETLETFHEATQDLTAATSRGTACRTAVEAATDVLDFPLVGVYLFDPSTTELQLVAATEHLESSESMATFGPGETLPWQVFVDGNVVRPAHCDKSVFEAGTPDPALVLPLGSHGVMLIGTSDDDIDAETVELAQILAATVAVALDHIEGTREIERREAELHEQQVRADRLDRLNTIIRDIEQATVEQSSNEQILQAVCDRLTEVEPFQVAVVGEWSEGEVPQVSASAGDRAYVESLESAGDIRGRHPAVTAAEDEEVCAVRRLAADTPHSAWEKCALRRGYQAVVAVPLAYEDTVHGVLTIIADNPTAFDEEEQTVLAELGRSIGYELTVLERERALESDTTTELEFHIADDGLLLVTLSAQAACRIELEQPIRRPDGTYSLFCTVEGTTLEEAAGVARRSPTVVTVEIVCGDAEEERGLLEITTTDWVGSLFTRHGVVLREAWADGGTGRLIIEVPGSVALRDLVATFQTQYPATEVLSKHMRQRAVRTLLELQGALAERVTDRQLEVLQTAYSAGYFEWPRDASGEDIATLLGITQPTFNKHLRAAEREAFAMLLERNLPE